MLRAALVVVTLALASCGDPNPGSGNCKCAPNRACVFVGSAMIPQCLPLCDVDRDAGACSAGTSCGCSASCQGCKNCIQVCS